MVAFYISLSYLRTSILSVFYGSKAYEQIIQSILPSLAIKKSSWGGEGGGFLPRNSSSWVCSDDFVTNKIPGFRIFPTSCQIIRVSGERKSVSSPRKWGREKRWGKEDK